MDNKIVEVFIPGPAGRLEAKYYKSNKTTSPIALVLQPHPQYGGTMNNKIVVDTFHAFMENEFSVCRVNFRGVGKSQGSYDNGEGELADAATAMDWLQNQHPGSNECWISGFSFGSWIGMQLMMRRPEITGFISVSPPASTHDFTFLAPCPVSGLIVQGGQNTLVTNDRIVQLVDKISKQKGVTIDVAIIEEANQFFSAHLNEAMDEVAAYVDARSSQTNQTVPSIIG